ncbi:hypothetical protein [Streptomyces cavernicola]|uniref:DUF3558 domain-containing protein n=1 Tax=Streptomyces cavernicola TaxID=3043613 RepID=A0ABT6SFL2_9ACTN|nr:hypothetical protein [Streptomyces sp. B-S-A6]MDI3406462.1 hypothetical protein [Streptomyces sp. B-S-A6]
MGSDQRHSSRTRIAHIAVGSTVALAVVVGALYFSGAYDSWTGKATSSAPCDGLVPIRQAEELLGARELTSDAPSWDGDFSQPKQCWLDPKKHEPDGEEHSLTVSASRTAGSRELLLDLDRFMSDSDTQTVSPIGHGWRGLLNTYTTDPRATVVMACDTGDRSDLTVNLRARYPVLAEPLTERQRVELARLATETAANVAERAGCRATEGDTVDSVAAPIPPRFDNTTAVAPGKATGTCANVQAPTRETATDPLAPVEDCIVVDASHTPSFRLAAYYGSYVEDGHVATYKRGDDGLFRGRSGEAEGVQWATATCPAQGGTAFFTAEPFHARQAPEPFLRRSAFRAFATRSAKEHGCEAPEFDDPRSE